MTWEEVILVAQKRVWNYCCLEQDFESDLECTIGSAPRVFAGGTQQKQESEEGVSYNFLVYVVGGHLSLTSRAYSDRDAGVLA